MPAPATKEWVPTESSTSVDRLHRESNSRREVRKGTHEKPEKFVCTQVVAMCSRFARIQQTWLLFGWALCAGSLTVRHKAEVHRQRGTLVEFRLCWQVVPLPSQAVPYTIPHESESESESESLCQLFLFRPSLLLRRSHSPRMSAFSSDCLRQTMPHFQIVVANIMCSFPSCKICFSFLQLVLAHQNLTRVRNLHCGRHCITASAR